MKSIFPEEMMNKAPVAEMSLDTIKAKLNFFELQVHEFHWQTHGLGEHMCLGDLYENIFNVKDEIVEKIMGYIGVRTKAMPVAPIKDYSIGSAEQITSEIIIFAKQLENFGSMNNMPDIENIAQSLSGDTAKIKYRLTLS
jgi:DNA-binding ferritin-like protein